MRRLQRNTARDSLDALDQLPVLLLMIWSGLLIYWANSVYRIGFGSFTLFQFFPDRFFNFLGVGHRLADGMALHFFFMCSLQSMVWLRAVHRHLRRMASLVAKSQILSGSDPGNASRFAPEQASSAAAQVQRRQQIAYTKRDFNGRRIGAYRARDLQTSTVAWLSNLLADMNGLDGALLVGDRLLSFLSCPHRTSNQGRLNNFRAMVTGYELVTVGPVPSDTNETKESFEAAA